MIVKLIVFKLYIKVVEVNIGTRKNLECKN